MIRPTDHPVGYITPGETLDLWFEFYFTLSEKWADGIMGCQSSGGLIMTDDGLDSMFWKGKGAFILGCTSLFKAIMIDRPGMGKVKN
jgi:hypothetical protein